VFDFNRVGLGSKIVFRGTIKDVMKSYRGFRVVSMAIFSVMWLGINVLGGEYFGVVFRKKYLLE
jgi:hypothetical protein